LFNNISLLLTHRTRIPCNRVPVSGRPGVPEARRLCRDIEICHAWRPLYAEKWIARRHWTPKHCYLGVRRTQNLLI